jgi:ABC-type transport system involved in multi-copper enzyme maturation permease subunit
MIVVGASLLLSALAGEQQTRILLDLGLSAIEFFALLTAGFAAVTLILEEMDSKTIYLVLTRPVARSTYLVGRYLGLLLAIYAGMLVMSCLHLGILFLKGWAFTPRYFLALFLSAEKITIIGSVALFFSLFSSSAVSSISFTVFFWLLGHFSEEISFLGSKLAGFLPQLLVKTVYYVIPNMQLFNLRDFWDVPGIAGGWVLASIVYGLFYSAFFLGLSLWQFKRREF